MESYRYRRVLLAGVAGGLSLNIGMILTVRVLGFGWNGGGILLDPAVQSSKLIAVWTELEPFPKVYADLLPIVVGLLGFGLVHAVVYQSLAPAWPAGVFPRAIRFAGLLFAIGFAFWEFFTPVNLFGEPLLLVGLEPVFWAAIAGAEAISIAVVSESARVERTIPGRTSTKPRGPHCSRRSMTWSATGQPSLQRPCSGAPPTGRMERS
jgi:hypothetical protein